MEVHIQALVLETNYGSRYLDDRIIKNHIDFYYQGFVSSVFHIHIDTVARPNQETQ